MISTTEWQARIDEATTKAWIAYSSDEGPAAGTPEGEREAETLARLLEAGGKVPAELDPTGKSTDPEYVVWIRLAGGLSDTRDPEEQERQIRACMATDWPTTI